MLFKTIPVKLALRTSVPALNSRRLKYLPVSREPCKSFTYFLRRFAVIVAFINKTIRKKRSWWRSRGERFIYSIIILYSYLIITWTIFFIPFSFKFNSLLGDSGSITTTHNPFMYRWMCVLFVNLVDSESYLSRRLNIRERKREREIRSVVTLFLHPRYGFISWTSSSRVSNAIFHTELTTVLYPLESGRKPSCF